MGLYGEIIKKREENNARMEQNADAALLQDRPVRLIEDEMEDVQTTVLYILGRFGIDADRLYGFHSISPLLDTMLDPLGMMYDYYEDTQAVCRKKTDFILAFRADNKAVAVIPTGMGYRYYCPGDASEGYASAAFCEGLKKGCYIFHRPLTVRKTILRTFCVHAIYSLRLSDVARLALATGLSAALGLGIPAVSRYIYQNYISSEHSAGGFAIAVFIYLLVVLIRALITTVKTLLLSETKIRASIEVESSVMAKLLHLPYAFFKDTSAGKISRRINSCNRLSDIILDIIMDVLLNLSFSAAYLVQLHSFSADMFGPAMIMLSTYILLSVLSAWMNMRKEARLLDLDMEYTDFLFSAIRGIQKIKGLGAGVFVYARWAEMYRKRLALTYRKPFLLKYSNEIMAGIRLLTTMVFLMAALNAGLRNTQYLTFLSSFALIMTVVDRVTDIMKNMFLTVLLCRNIAPILEMPAEETESLEYVRSLQGNIRLEDVTFSYEKGSRPCLDGFSAEIKSGEKLAIVGESGCGKSTLLKILLGLEKPDSGNVFYDEKSISGLNQKSLRKCIGSVFQFSRLFPGTIAENIAFGKEEYADMGQIWAAADAAVIGDDIRSLPLQMNTEISESNSGGFSGGQRQRLLLARAFLANPRILLLDEATSALDNESQRAVLEHVRRMKATVIMVAHRLSTVEQFDRIIMIENGKIAEEGKYSELMERNGKFAELVRRQLL